MAESQYGPIWPMSTSSVNQSSDLTAPLQHAHMPPVYPHLMTYTTPYPHPGNSQMSSYPDISPPPFGGPAQRMSPFPLDPNFQNVWFCPPPLPHMNGYYSQQPRLPATFRQSHGGVRPDSMPLPEVNDPYSASDYPPMRELPLQPTGYDMPLSPTNSNNIPLRPPHPGDFSQSPAAHYGGYDHHSGATRGSTDRPRAMHFHGRGGPQYRSLDTERRAAIISHAQNRRSDRSVSPRTSTARRNYDRFSHDLPMSSTSSDAEEAAARIPPSNRARHRPREPRPRFFSASQHFDPNVATPRQVQELKDKLPRRLPADLKPDTSPTCDICQKDYSTTAVQPSEEEEIAIELPCGHLFGQFCIFQWVRCAPTMSKFTDLLT